MRISKKKLVTLFVLTLLIGGLLLVDSIVPINAQFEPPATVVWWQKPGAEDYAWNGVPDFDQKQDNWTNPITGNWSWCGPVAVANSLWWWDSWIDGGINHPPAIEDHFPLVQNYGPWDDHDPKNVVPFVKHLARLMGTDVNQSGTNVYDMQRGIRLYLEEKGLNMSFYERTWYCNYTWEDVLREFLKCEDIIFLLGFYQYDELTGEWYRVGGHYVTLAGIGNDTAVGGQPWVKFSDPFLDWAETMGWLGYVQPPHALHPGNSTVHNNATIVSHDPYAVVPGPGPTGLFHLHLGIPEYPVEELFYLGGLADNGDVEAPYNPALQTWTGVDAVVVFSPKQYDKPPYEEYAPSGVPDFDQKQDNWTNPTTGKWSWCGPTALANSLWWFDSKFDNGTEPDGFPLVQSYGPWDDHDPRNVVPLISELAWLADTDGQRTGIPHQGTYVWDLENATRWYLKLKGLNDTFYERTWHCNFTFADIEYEVERSEDVILLLGFYEWREPPGEWVRLGGHYVTVSGVNANGTIKFSDPAIDWAEMGGVGEVLPPGHTHVPPGNTTLHNNASYVSHDWYRVDPKSPIIDTHFGIPDYPAYDVFSEVNGADEGDIWQGGLVYTAVEYAVIISPRPVAPPPGIHDVTVIDVTPHKTIVSQGFNVRINVTVANQGNFTETFNVTAYANTTAIQTLNVTNLPPGNSTTITFTWNTTGFAKGNYIISANATVVYGETNTTNNSYADGTVRVNMVGDIWPEFGIVDIGDIVYVAIHFGAVKGGPGYEANADINCDGIIDITDIVIIAIHFGETDP